MENRPTGRNKKVIGNGGSVQKRGSGLGTGPVGNQGGYSGRKASQGAAGQGRPTGGHQGRPTGGFGGPRPGVPTGTQMGGQMGGPVRSTMRGTGGGFGKLIFIVAVIAIIFFVFKGGLGSLSGADYAGTDYAGTDYSGSDYSGSGNSGSNSSQSASDLFGGTTDSASADTLRPGYSLFDLLNSMSGYTTTSGDYTSYMGNAPSVYSGQYADTTGDYGSAYSQSQVDNSVSSEAREKYTTIYGDGSDKVTVMVYMCGTDLESKSGMASSDLKEMTGANISDDVNVIVYTGGCSRWQNSVVSNSVNQIYEVKKGGVRCLEDNMGKGAMTDPNTLTEFIKYCTANYPANRQELIFWDHGSGSVSGYGYDEKNQRAGSMTLDGINKALKNAGTKFDFIGFDACLMGTVENAMMLSSYADYLVGSEETEPGIGWYYTNWLTKLSQNTATPTTEIGKAIVDDFVDVCNQRCRGQKATLSVVDLAELQETLPSKLSAFSKSTTELINTEDYKKVSDARNNTKEFAASSKIDQIDFIDFANKLGTEEAKAMVKVLDSAIKYNRTATCVSNAYGLSIYFPYKKVSKLDSLLKTYDNIGMDSDYSRCIKEFAKLELNGQLQGSGTTSAIPSLMGGYAGSTQASSSPYSSADVLLSMMDSFGFFGRSAPEQDRYVENTTFDNANILWNHNSDGSSYISMPEDQWSLVESLELNVFYDDGQGYIDLGMDNVFDFDDNGNLLGDYDGSWMSIDGQIVPYYFLGCDNTANGQSIYGYVPAFLNGERVRLILVFDDVNPDGYIAGAEPVYANGETETIAKNLLDVGAGDTLEFICDYYTYSGDYVDSYLIGQPLTLGSSVTIGNIVMDDATLVPTYCFTDIYQLKHWTLPF